MSPEGGPLSKVTLANLNSRIRKDGLSAHEIWTQRDQVTGEQLPIVDRQLILHQNFSRHPINHAASSKSKAHGRYKPHACGISVGDLVYLRQDRDKTKARDRYLVVNITDEICHIRKFTKSQFRSKLYEVKATDCYCIPQTVLAQSPQGPIRGTLDLADSDSESLPGPSESPHMPLYPTAPNLPDQPLIPEAIASPPQERADDPPDTITDPEPCAPSDTMTDSNVQAMPNPNTTPMRRSTRLRHTPKWMSDDWVYP